MPSPTGPAYRIVTPRLVLRCWDPADTPALQELIAANLDHLRPWVEWAAREPVPLPEKLREVRKWRGEFDLDFMWHYAVLTRADERLIGSLVFTRRIEPDTVECGAWIDVREAGHGYSAEANSAGMRAIFELIGFTRIQATSDATNDRAGAVLRKMGFAEEGTIRHVIEARHEDERMWSVLADEWPSTPAAALAAGAEAYDAMGGRLF